MAWIRNPWLLYVIMSIVRLVYEIKVGLVKLTNDFESKS